MPQHLHSFVNFPLSRLLSAHRIYSIVTMSSPRPITIAIIGAGEGREDQILTFKRLNESVAAAQQGLKEMGVTRGTRIAAFVPNCAETVILMLAATATGAVWTSCSPDFGSQGVVDRFGQVAPSVMIVANGYNYNGKVFSLEQKINKVLEVIDSIETVISIEFTDVVCKLNHSSVINYHDLVSNDATVPEFVQLPFDHPLYIMYSSGTTGPPKSIIHGAGGTLIQHLKEHQCQYSSHHMGLEVNGNLHW